jgi:hypothetical protein
MCLLSILLIIMMKKFGSVSFTIAVFSTLLLIGMSVFTVQKLVANAAVADWQQGVSIQSRYAGDFESDAFKQSIQDLKATGANSVSLIIPYWQSNKYSSDIALAQHGPSDTTLIAAINYIHSQGLQVMLKPHIEAGGEAWRAYIDPSDRAAWFANYSAMLNHLGDIGKQTGVEAIAIGSELISVSTYTSNADNTQQWINMINSLRSRYPGKVTYSANWGGPGFTDEIHHIGFWNNLDYMGIAAYFNLNTNTNDYNALKSAWDLYRTRDIEPLYNQYQKPIVFTEVGYRSVAGAHNRPWDYSTQGPADLQEQANSYEALFRYWDQYDYMQGVQLWDWKSDPNAGGANDNDYTPQNKLAETVMLKWFGGTTPPPPVNPPATTTPTTTPPVNPPATTTPPVNPPATTTPTTTPPVNPPATTTPPTNPKPTPTVATLPAQMLGTNAATLVGTVNMNGGRGTVWFEYSTDGKTWPGKAGVKGVSGNTTQEIRAVLNNVQPGKTYYYKIMAENYTGGFTKKVGQTLTFRTP